ncbi:MAG: hypothetical protein Q9221_008898 [Calogaya cf. arnoldii]
MSPQATTTAEKDSQSVKDFSVKCLNGVLEDSEKGKDQECTSSTAHASKKEPTNAVDEASKSEAKRHDGPDPQPHDQKHRKQRHRHHSANQKESGSRNPKDAHHKVGHRAPQSSIGNQSKLHKVLEGIERSFQGKSAMDAGKGRRMWPGEK